MIRGAVILAAGFGLGYAHSMTHLIPETRMCFVECTEAFVKAMDATADRSTPATEEVNAETIEGEVVA